MPELAAARAVSAAHAAVADPARWAEVLDALCEALSADTAAFGLRNAVGVESGALCPRTDPAWHARYRDDGLARANFLWDAAMRARPGSAMTEAAAAQRDDYLRSEIYNRFIRPQGMDAVLTLTLANGTQGTALMTFGRRAGRMLSASAGGAALLAEGRARLGGGRLFLPGVPGLARALAQATRPRDAWPPAVGADLAAPGLSGRVAPWCGGDSIGAGPPLALVILRRTGPGFGKSPVAADVLVRRFGLTATEARIAADLATGATLPAAADRAGIRLTTARTHLQRVFDKTGARSQGALVALLRPGDWPEPPV